MAFVDVLTSEIILTAFTILTQTMAGMKMTAVTNANVEKTVRHTDMLAMALMAIIPVTKAAADPQTPGIMNA